MHNPNQDPLHNPLRSPDTQMEVMPLTFVERVRALVRDELAHRHISQRVAAERLAQYTGEPWSQSKVHKILTGQVEFSLADLAAFARILDLSIPQITREPGREFVGDLTPSEFKALEALREMSPRRLAAILEIIGEPEPRKPGRRTIHERMRRKE